MKDAGRRRFLVATGAVLSSATATGCLSNTGATTPNDPDAVGEIAAVNGIEITFVDYSVESEIRYVPRGNRVTVADDADEREPETVEPASVDGQFLVVVVRIANVADEPKGIPSSAFDGTLFSEGEIYLEYDGTKQRPVPVGANAPNAVGGAYQYEGDWIDRLSLVVGSVDAELQAETSITGWVLYEVSPDFDPNEAVLVAYTNPEGSNYRLTWPFATE